MNVQELPGLDHSVEEHREKHTSQEACHTHDAGEQLRDGEKIEKTLDYSASIPKRHAVEQNVLVEIQEMN